MSAAAQPLEELAVPDEDHSTGTAWHAPRPQAPAELPPHITPCTPGQQAQHRAELADAISGFAVGRALHRSSARTNSGRGQTR